MGLFNNYYGRSYSDDRRQSNNSNTCGSGRFSNNNGRNAGGHQQRHGGDNWSGGSATSSPEPIDFSVNDIVFDRKSGSSDSLAGGGGGARTGAVNWRQNDIDFGRQQRQRNSWSSDDDINDYNRQANNQHHSQQYNQYNSKLGPAQQGYSGRNNNSGYGMPSVGNSRSCYDVPPPPPAKSHSNYTIYGGQSTNSYSSHRGTHSMSYNSSGGSDMPPVHNSYSIPPTNNNSVQRADNAYGSYNSMQPDSCHNSSHNSYGLQAANSSDMRQVWKYS